MATPDAPAPAKPSDILPDVLAVLQTATQEGLSYPELPIATKQQLGRLGIYGSAAENTPSARETWATHRAHNAQDRALGRLAANTSDDMAAVPEYAAARREKTLGLTMALAWTTVRAIRSSGVYVVDPVRNSDGKITEGIVTALVTTATFESEDDAGRWHTMVQGTHNRSPVKHIVRPRAASKDWAQPEAWSPAWIPPELPFEEINGVFVQGEPKTPPGPLPPRVEVTGLTEYDRIINEAIYVRIRQELAEIGIVLPRKKVSLEDWLKTTTLHPEIETWLRAIDDTYNMMHSRGFVTADYIDGENLRPGKRDHIAATDPSAASKAKRDELNGRIHDVRGGDSRNNAEQHPDRNQRYYLERGVHLRRPKPPAKDQKYEGTPAARPLNPVEKAVIEMQETWRAVRNNPKQRLPEILPELIGNTASKIFGGALDIGVSAGVLAAKGLVAGWKGVRNYANDIVSFRKNKKAARRQLQTIHAELWQLRQQIANREVRDEFPSQEHTLEPSKQLEVIQKMTSFMLERLSQGGTNIVDGE